MGNIKNPTLRSGSSIRYPNGKLRCETWIHPLKRGQKPWPNLLPGGPYPSPTTRGWELWLITPFFFGPILCHNGPTLTMGWVRLTSHETAPLDSPGAPVQLRPSGHSLQPLLGHMKWPVGAPMLQAFSADVFGRMEKHPEKKKTCGMKPWIWKKM